MKNENVTENGVTVLQNVTEKQPKNVTVLQKTGKKQPENVTRLQQKQDKNVTVLQKNSKSQTFEDFYVVLAENAKKVRPVSDKILKQFLETDDSTT